MLRFSTFAFKSRLLIAAGVTTACAPAFVGSVEQYSWYVTAVVLRFFALDCSPTGSSRYDKSESEHVEVCRSNIMQYEAETSDTNIVEWP